MFSIFFFIFCFSLEGITIHFLCSILLFLLTSPCSSVCFSTSLGNKKDPSAESRVRVFTFEKWLLSFIFSHATPLSHLYLLPALLACSWEHSCPHCLLSSVLAALERPSLHKGLWAIWNGLCGGQKLSIRFPSFLVYRLLLGFVGVMVSLYFY